MSSWPYGIWCLIRRQPSYSSMIGTESATTVCRYKLKLILHSRLRLQVKFHRLLCLCHYYFHPNDTLVPNIATLGVPTRVWPGRGTFGLKIGTFPRKSGLVAILRVIVGWFKLKLVRTVHVGLFVQIKHVGNTVYDI